VLFISDIRTANWKEMTESEVENRVLEDNKWMESWVTIMEPVKAMLKFKVPYPNLPEMKKMGGVDYLAGEILLPIWGPVTTTETRLIPDIPIHHTHYDFKAYEDLMFHFNTVKRQSYYPHEVTGSLF